MPFFYLYLAHVISRYPATEDSTATTTLANPSRAIGFHAEFSPRSRSTSSCFLDIPCTGSRIAPYSIPSPFSAKKLRQRLRGELIPPKIEGKRKGWRGWRRELRGRRGHCEGGGKGSVERRHFNLRFPRRYRADEYYHFPVATPRLSFPSDLSSIGFILSKGCRGTSDGYAWDILPKGKTRNRDGRSTFGAQRVANDLVDSTGYFPSSAVSWLKLGQAQKLSKVRNDL